MPNRDTAALPGDRDCGPRDSVDVLLESWSARRPDLDFDPVAVISRLDRVRVHVDTALEALFARNGLSSPSFAVLVTLARLEERGGVTQRRLMDELGLTSGTVSVRIDRLVEQGLVERRNDPSSKRSVLIALTASGRELFERVVPAHLANEERLLAALSDDERRLLAALLRKLLVEFEGSKAPDGASEHLGLVLTPAHVTIEMRESVGLPRVSGLLVRLVQPDSPAARADICPGDVLVEAGAHELRSSAALYAAVEEAAGATLPLELLRGTERLRTKLALGPNQAIDGRAMSAGPRVRAEHSL